MSTYAIGDIQGCLTPLQQLLDKVAFDASQDTLWIAGDMVNRGPDSLATLRFLRGLGSAVTAVLGNHDLHLLAVAYGHKTPSRHDTLNALLKAPDCHELLNWLRHRPLLHRDHQRGFSMVHAGIPPVWSLDDAAPLAREVEAQLQGDNCNDFLAHMYGNEPNLWRDSLTGYPRLRLITNYFTRMRFCRANGELDLHNKTAHSRDAHFLPWFAHPAHLCRHEPIIFGHWASLEGRTQHHNVFALDTGCVWGGRLSALRLEDRKIFSQQCS